MQVIYVDVLIFVNIIEDFLFLLCVRRITRADTRYPRLIAAAAAGGLLSVLSLMRINGFLINLLITSLSAALLVLIAFGYGGLRAFLRRTLTLIVVSFLFSGAMIFLWLALRPSGMAVINNRVYFNISPILLIILTLVIYAVLFLYNRFFRNRASPATVKEVTVYYSDKEIKLRCKTDTGMNVREPFSGSRVIIADKRLFENTAVKEKDCRVIPFNSLGGKGMIRGFRADGVLTDGSKCGEELYIGMCEGIFNGEIDGLIPPDIILKKDGKYDN